MIAVQLNITTEAAAECLKTAWTADNEAKKQAWEQQELADQEEAAQRAQEEENQCQDEEPQHNNQNETREVEKKKPKLNSFIANHPIAMAIDLGMIPPTYCQHFIDQKIEELLIDLCDLMGEHSGENMAEAVWETLTKYGISDHVCSPLHFHCRK